jgi:hypothetical protein
MKRCGCCDHAWQMFVGCEAFRGLQPASKIVSRNKVGEVAAQLVVGFVVVAFDCCLFGVRFIRST